MNRYLYVALLLVGCGGAHDPVDGGVDANDLDVGVVGSDAGAGDAGAGDAAGDAGGDAGAGDAGAGDAGGDAGAGDAAVDAGADAGADTGPPTPIRGVVRYEDRPQDALGFTGDIFALPAPGVRVRLLRSSGTLIEEVRTDVDGNFEFTSTSGASVQALSDASFGDHRVQVADRSFRSVLYDVEAAVVPGMDVSILAEANRAGGAFNVAAIVYRAFELYEPYVGPAADPVVFRWERGRAFGCGSCYGSNVVSLGGGFDDTDEYDDVIILHELGHYFVEHYSADSSSGGTHRDMQVSPVLAYGEGVGYAFAQLILDAPFIVDTFAADVRSIDVEVMTIGGVELGVFSNTSDGTLNGLLREEIVNGIIWDAYDDASAAEPFDRVALGVPGIMQILVDHFGAGPHPNQGAAGIDLADFLHALVCVTGVPAADAQSLADDRAFPWTAPTGC